MIPPTLAETTAAPAAAQIELKLGHVGEPGELQERPVPPPERPAAQRIRPVGVTRGNCGKVTPGCRLRTRALRTLSRLLDAIGARYVETNGYVSGTNSAERRLPRSLPSDSKNRLANAPAAPA